MSKKIEALFGDMKSIFGESFGSAGKPVNLSEAIEDHLIEKRRGFGAKGDPVRNVISKGQHFPPEQKKFGAAPKKSNEPPPTIRRPMPKKDGSGDHKSLPVDMGRSAGAAKPTHVGGQGHEQGAPRGGAGGGNTHHNPFKRSSNLGTGPGTPPGFRGTGPRHHDQAKCWSCKCGNVYTKGCTCVGTGANKDCKKGEIKHVKINRGYRHAYNNMYHAWRRGQHGAVTRRLQGK